MTKEEMYRFYEMMEEESKKAEELKKIFDLQKLMKDIDEWSIDDD